MTSSTAHTAASTTVILATHALGPSPTPWRTIDPFLFYVHHHDAYPPGNGNMGPNAPLAGRQLGQDFAGKDGWNMHHGQQVPGFPAHPHCGFETVTLVRQGLIDHADSLGAAARFGHGDVQWLTAGRGIVHSEMFPLLNVGAANPTELFQIWLNLPGRLKMAAPPPDSWAAQAGSGVAIWTLKLEPGATWTLLAAHTDAPADAAPRP